MIQGSATEPPGGRALTEPDSSPSRKPPVAQAAFLAVLALGGGLAALRVEPRVWGDPGAWLSVADRPRESLGRPLAVAAAAGTLAFAGWSSLEHEDLTWSRT